jgi:hypothetical protein
MNYRPYIPLAIALLTLLGVAMLYSLGYFFVSHASTKAATLASDVRAKTTQLERAARAHVALSTLEDSEADLQHYEINKADIVPFLESIQSTGRPYGAVVNVSAVADEKDGTHPRVALSLTISGTFDAVLRTVGVIEYGPYDGVITNFSLNTPGPDAKGVAPWTATVTYSVGVRTP